MYVYSMSATLGFHGVVAAVYHQLINPKLSFRTWLITSKGFTTKTCIWLYFFAFNFPAGSCFCVTTCWVFSLNEYLQISWWKFITITLQHKINLKSNVFKQRSVHSVWPWLSRCSPAASRSAGRRQVPTPPSPSRPVSAARPAGPPPPGAPSADQEPAPAASASRPSRHWADPTWPSHHPLLCAELAPRSGHAPPGWYLREIERTSWKISDANMTGPPVFKYCPLMHWQMHILSLNYNENITTNTTCFFINWSHDYLYDTCHPGDPNTQHL